MDGTNIYIILPESSIPEEKKGKKEKKTTKYDKNQIKPRHFSNSYTVHRHFLMKPMARLIYANELNSNKIYFNKYHQFIILNIFVCF